MCHFRAYHLTNHRFVCLFFTRYRLVHRVHQSHPSVFTLAGGYQSFWESTFFEKAQLAYNLSATIALTTKQSLCICCFHEKTSGWNIIFSLFTFNSFDHTQCSSAHRSMSNTERRIHSNTERNVSVSAQHYCRLTIVYLCDGLCSTATNIDDKCI